MSEKLLSYYSDWKNETATCPRCGWAGRVGEGRERYFSELLDVCCPKCSEMLAIICYPTRAEAAVAARAGDPDAARNVARLELADDRWQRFQQDKLLRPAQLPDLEGDRLDFILDCDEPDSEQRASGRETVYIIKYGDRIVWQELAWWENARRYKELVALLKGKYGDRFGSLKATWYAETYLRGDAIENLYADIDHVARPAIFAQIAGSRDSRDNDEPTSSGPGSTPVARTATDSGSRRRGLSDWRKWLAVVLGVVFVLPVLAMMALGALVFITEHPGLPAVLMAIAVFVVLGFLFDRRHWQSRC